MNKVFLGKNFPIELGTLIDTRLLVEANSGGGKSYAIRKLLEETHGLVQHIVLDVEGDFSSLRECYDYIVAGKEGDIPATPKTAEYLAQKILELQADIIIDLYELKHHERIRFVKLFLESMINAPKKLWHPCLVVVDEAHIFCPQHGNAESMSAVIELQTRGRKRGFCGVLATQRLSKLHKDAAAESNNKLIGRTGMDIDVKRAADELGMSSKDGKILRDLNPGEFYAFGPAISRSVVKMQVGACVSTHPKAGSRKLSGHAPAPTKKIKSVLSQLSDLEKEAETDLNDKKAVEEKIRSLEAENRRLLRGTSGNQKNIPSSTITVRNRELEKVIKQNVERAVKETKKKMLTSVIDKLQTLLTETNHTLKNLDYVDKMCKSTKEKSHPTFKMTAFANIIKAPYIENKEYGLCERKILGFLSIRSGFFTRTQIGVMTGYAPNSGSFSTSLSKLRSAELILKDGQSYALNPEKDVSALTENVSCNISDWVQNLGGCERKIYEFMLTSPEKAIDKEGLAVMTGYSNSGSFNTALSKLSTLGLIKRESGGMVRINPEIQGL